VQQTEDGCIGLGTVFISKTLVIGDAASADEEAAATFPAGLKKLSRRENTILGNETGLFF
jgi:hypothetical protein